MRPAEFWENDTVTLMNLVDLGTNVTRDLEAHESAHRPVDSRPGFTNRPPPDGRLDPPPPEREFGSATTAAGPIAPPPADFNRRRTDTNGDRRPRADERRASRSGRRWAIAAAFWPAAVDERGGVQVHD